MGNNNSTNSAQAGFTLIELLITTSLTVLLMLTITSLFMTFLLGNSKTNVRKIIKEEGLHAISQMEFLIKNARYYDDSFQPCADNQSSIRIIGLDNGITTYQVQDGKIASNSSRLTSDTVTLSSLRFDCSGVSGNRQIKISFTLAKDIPTLGANENISESFETIINMRN
jgi:competence protein ComGC